METRPPTPYTDPVKRVALLGATGSIGRQAIEIVEAHPELELCAAASGSTPLDDVDAPLKAVGGDLTELLERAEPDVVLNAVVGFAGVHATLWALEHGVDLALANKESLVAAGELALAARERGGGRILPVDSEHSALFQCLEGREPEQIDTLVLTGSGGPFRGRTPGRARGRDARAGARTSDLAHGAEDHGGLRNAREQRARGDRGALPVRPADYDRIEVAIQPTSIVHSLVRFRDGAALAHLGYPDMRVPISYALTYPERAATPLPPLDLSSLDARVLAARHGDVPDARRSPAPRGRRAEARRASTTPRTRSPSPPSSPAACPSSRIPEVVGETLAAAETDPVRDVDDLVDADRAARKIAEGALAAA